MADAKLAYSSLSTMTVTNLHSLASSVTAGWQSAEVDNTSDLYIDAIVQVVADFANTSPGNDKSLYVFAAAGIETGSLSNPASGTEGSITLTSISNTGQSIRPIGIIPYETQNEIVESSPMSVARAFGGIMPPFWAIVVMNYSGAALHSSGNTVKWRGVYNTG